MGNFYRNFRINSTRINRWILESSTLSPEEDDLYEIKAWTQVTLTCLIKRLLFAGESPLSESTRHKQVYDTDSVDLIGNLRNENGDGNENGK